MEMLSPMRSTLGAVEERGSVALPHTEGADSAGVRDSTASRSSAEVAGAMGNRRRQKD